MKFGTFHYQSVPPWTNQEDVAQHHFDQIVQADRCGFHEVWLAEHNAREFAMVGNVWMFAAAVASATSRIRIGSAVSRLPVHHPLHLAEDIALVDILSRGRVDFGIGRGYDQAEFEAYGIPFEEREGRWDEVFAAVRQAWATGSTAFDGKYYQHAEGTMIPMPLQKPEIPIYVMVSGSERSIRVAAEQLLPIVSTSGPTAPELRQRLQMYAQIASDHGHPDDQIIETLNRCWQSRPVHVAPRREQAIAQYKRGLEWFMEAQGNRAKFGFFSSKRPYESYVEHHAVVLGTPEQVAEELGEYCQESGVNNIIGWFNMGGQPHPQVMESLASFGEIVIPKLKDVSYDWGTVVTPSASPEAEVPVA